LRSGKLMPRDARRAPPTVTDTTARPWRFLVSVLAFSIPFYVWGIFWPHRGLPFGLPATVTMVIVPAAVATVMSYQECGTPAARVLWQRIVDLRRVPNRTWLAVALFAMPLATVIAVALLRIGRVELPAAIRIAWTQIPALLVVYCIGAMFEEIGWTGYATQPLQRRYGVLRAGLLIGAVWALWHVVPWAIGQGHTPGWVIGQSLVTILMRLSMGWIYARGGQSVFLATVFHAMGNVSYSLFPNAGSHYNPTAVAGALALIIAVSTPFIVRRGGLGTPPEAG
jgi:CAAX protease family protein